jgi:hypothetical protein
LPRYIVERSFPGRLLIAAGAEGVEHSLAVVERNAEEGVT